MPQTALEETEELNAAAEAGELDSFRDEIEVSIEDDTPEEDRGRAPMPDEIVQDLEADELEQYSKERGKQLRKVWHDERRAKEAATRERETAIKYAQKVLEENRALKLQLGHGEEALINSAKSSAEGAVLLAKKAFKEAYDSGDTDAVAEAQEALVSAKLRLDSAEQYIPQYSEEALQTAANAVNIGSSNTVTGTEQQNPGPDRHALAWQERNPWWGNNRIMTSMAFGIHEDLVRKGVDPVQNWERYYASIDKEMQKRFPEEFGDGAAGSGSPNRARKSQTTVVSPATRTNKPKQLVLTESEARVAARLGLDPKAYAKEKYKLAQTV